MAPFHWTKALEWNQHLNSWYLHMLLQLKHFPLTANENLFCTVEMALFVGGGCCFRSEWLPNPTVQTVNHCKFLQNGGSVLWSRSTSTISWIERTPEHQHVEKKHLVPNYYIKKYLPYCTVYSAILLFNVSLQVVLKQPRHCFYELCWKWPVYSRFRAVSPLILNLFNPYLVMIQIQDIYCHVYGLTKLGGTMKFLYT